MTGHETLFLIRQFAMSAQVFNPNPIVFSTSKAQRTTEISPHSLWVNDLDDDQLQVESDNSLEPIDQEEIFGMRVYPFYSQFSSVPSDLIRSIYDPEHPNTLEELRVVSAPQITIGSNHIKVEFTPTVPHCGMSTLIGPYSTSFSSSSLLKLLCRTVYPCSALAKLARTVQTRYRPQTWLAPERERRYVLHCCPDSIPNNVFFQSISN